ncbi:MAG: SHOCT domain-containing protein [Deltaproteobacteria bacterium]|nr:SHOCT domain-containing protein [Deltaproteobacteria bacterium]
MARSKENESFSQKTRNQVGFSSWLGSLGIFYLILLGLISIPLVVVMVVLFIRTMFAYRAWIMAGFGCLLLLAIVFVIRRRRQIAGRYDREKGDLMEIIRAAAREGHNVNVSFMHGLIRLDYEGRVEHEHPLIQARARSPIQALPMKSGGNTSAAGQLDAKPLRVADELEKLHDLLKRGIVSEAEFQELKEQLLKESRSRHARLQETTDG